MGNPSWLHRLLLWAFRLPVVITFFIGVNFTLIAYIVWQEDTPYAFDHYPYIFLNLLLAVASFDMSIIIVVAQIVASYRTDAQDALLAAGVQKSSENTDLIAFGMQNTLAMMKALEEMGEREAERDTMLHALVREGHTRFTITEKLLLDRIEERNDKAPAPPAA